MNTWHCKLMIFALVTPLLSACLHGTPGSMVAGQCECCSAGDGLREKIEVDELRMFLNPIPLGVVSSAMSVDLDTLWTSLRAGLSVKEIALENRRSAQVVIDALAAAHLAQVDYWVCGNNYTADEIAALKSRAKQIASEFVLNPFDLRNADSHIMMAATDWGDPGSAGTCMQGPVGGRLLDLKYRLDVYDDVRGGQHNFNSRNMTECELQLVVSFGVGNQEALLAVADEASACGAPNYARWLVSIGDGTFGQ